MTRRKRNKLSVERLENRSLMAGNVTAFMSGPDLIIEGDDAVNTISIESFGDNVVQVRGFNDNTLTPTSVNLTPNGLRLFFDVTGDILLHMNGGGDVVRISNLIVDQQLIIDMGGGNNELFMGRDVTGSNLRFEGTGSGPLYVAAEMIITTGNENDTVVQSDTHVGGESSITFNAGNDQLLIRRPAQTGLNVEYFNALTVLPGDGVDSVDVTGLIAHGLTIEDRSGQLNAQLFSMDIYGTLKVLGGGNTDFMNINATNTRGQVLLAPESSQDFVNYSGIAGYLKIEAGDGDDRVSMSAALDELYLILESGNDLLDMNQVSARLITVHGNDGNDTFNVRGVWATEATFYGDKNTDTYREPIVPPNRIRRLNRFTIERFETF